MKGRNRLAATLEASAAARCDSRREQAIHRLNLGAPWSPPAPVCAVRSLVRHRESLVRTGCEQLQRVQKSLDQMNLHLHHVISDISGETGPAILDAILKGERDGMVLARLRNDRCKAGEATIAKAPRGGWREERPALFRGIEPVTREGVDVRGVRPRSARPENPA